MGRIRVPPVTAIVVNYNGAAFIGEALRSLLDQTVPPNQIIVVDNASSDDSVAFIRDTFPNIEVIEAGANLGFAGGNNLGAANARGEFLAVLNSDAVADPRWIEALSAELQQNPHAGAAVGKILLAERPGLIDQAGALFNNLGNYWGRGYADVDEGQFDVACEVAGFTGCAGMIRREALAGSPPFDESIFMYGEELDLTIRLRTADWSIVYTPGAVVHHSGMKSVRATQTSPRLFQQRLANRNRVRLLLKYYPARLLVRSAPLIAIGLCYWTVMFLVHGGPRASLSFVREQLAAMRRGLRERDAKTVAASDRWLPWMTHHTLAGVLRQLRSRRRVE